MFDYKIKEKHAIKCDNSPADNSRSDSWIGLIMVFLLGVMPVSITFTLFEEQGSNWLFIGPIFCMALMLILSNGFRFLFNHRTQKKRRFL